MFALTGRARESRPLGRLRSSARSSPPGDPGRRRIYTARRSSRARRSGSRTGARGDGSSSSPRRPRHRRRAPATGHGASAPPAHGDRAAAPEAAAEAGPQAEPRAAPVPTPPKEVPAPGRHRRRRARSPHGATGRLIQTGNTQMGAPDKVARPPVTDRPPPAPPTSAPTAHRPARRRRGEDHRQTAHVERRLHPRCPRRRHRGRGHRDRHRSTRRARSSTPASPSPSATASTRRHVALARKYRFSPKSDQRRPDPHHLPHPHQVRAGGLACSLEFRD
jgi:hypothetical protein